MRNLLTILFVAAIFFTIYPQDTINVPGDHSTIQAAINSANNGDLVLVADGTYQENINFKGKAITVASQFIIDKDTSHITHTIIDGSAPIYPDSASVVSFISGEDTTSAICGFTIRGGNGTTAPNIRAGGGVLVHYSGAKITHNLIEYNNLNNASMAYGGGIFASYTSTNIIIEDNIIQNNTCNGTQAVCGGGIAVFTEVGYVIISNNKILNNSITAGGTATGGGIDIWGPINEVLIVCNIIKGNTVQTNNLGGGGIDIYNCTTNTPVIENNIIVDNYSSINGGGILVDLASDHSFKPELNQNQRKVPDNYNLPVQYLTNNTLYHNNAGVSGGGIYTAVMISNIKNCILWGNISTSNPQIAGTVVVTYSDVEGGWSGTGNMNNDPLFDMGSEYYHLGGTSLCIDMGDPNPIYNDAKNPHSTGNPLYPAQGTLRNDIGHCGGPSSLWGYQEWPVPVELSAFTATLQSGRVNLQWTTATEINNLGFEIERKVFRKSNPGNWVRIDFVEGYGTTADPQNYFYLDDISNLQASSLAYRLKQIDFDGSYEYSNEILVDNSIPTDYALSQNYPNPFNPVTIINYSLPVKSPVELVVYNVLGQSVIELVNEFKEAGSYEIEFNAATLPSGIYFYRLQAGNFVKVRKMTLLK